MDGLIYGSVNIWEINSCWVSEYFNMCRRCVFAKGNRHLTKFRSCLLDKKDYDIMKIMMRPVIS